MNIVIVPIFNDNYAFLLINPDTKEAIAIDPAEPGPVEKVLEAQGAKLTHVFCTHHHYDHTGGNEALAGKYPDLKIIGSTGDAARIPHITTQVESGETIEAAGLSAKVIDVSCHTGGHVAFLFGDNLFCGDALFVGGCGRFFEGTAVHMHNALIVELGKLPDETKVFCGHEYTLSNLRYALAVEPNNEATKAKMAWSEEQREKGVPTIPSTLGQERSYNPFMRVHEPDVQAFAGETDPVKVMLRLREKKNTFRG